MPRATPDERRANGERNHRHTEDAPRWTIDSDTFRTTYTAHIRDLDAFDRGYGHG